MAKSKTDSPAFSSFAWICGVLVRAQVDAMIAKELELLRSFTLVGCVAVIMLCGVYWPHALFFKALPGACLVFWCVSCVCYFSPTH